jgi:hypothetical protein
MLLPAQLIRDNKLEHSHARFIQPDVGPGFQDKDIMPELSQHSPCCFDDLPGQKNIFQAKSIVHCPEKIFSPCSSHLPTPALLQNICPFSVCSGS